MMIIMFSGIPQEHHQMNTSTINYTVILYISIAAEPLQEDSRFRYEIEKKAGLYVACHRKYYFRN